MHKEAIQELDRRLRTLDELIRVYNREDDKRWSEALRGSISFLAAAAPQPAASPDENGGRTGSPPGMPLTPDMFWDASDGERFGHDIETIVSDYAPGSIVTIDQAMRLKQIKVLVVRGDDGGNTWKLVDGAKSVEDKA